MSTSPVDGLYEELESALHSAERAHLALAARYRSDCEAASDHLVAARRIPDVVRYFALVARTAVADSLDQEGT